MKNDIRDLDQHALTKPHQEFSCGAKKAIENFSECLNKLLDNEFLAIKKIFYPNTWKLGLCINRFEKDFVTYKIYPINTENKDLLITYNVNNELKSEMNYRGYYRSNPIYESPSKHALEIISDKVKEFISNEYFMSFSQIYIEEYIFNTIYNDKTNILSSKNSFDKISLLELKESMLLTKEISEFEKFNTFINYLDDKGIKEIKRPYDIKYLKKNENYDSKDYFHQKIKVVFENLPKVFDEVFQLNFPLLSSGKKYFSNFDTVFVNINDKNENEIYGFNPCINIYYAKSTNDDIKGKVIFLNDHAEDFIFDSGSCKAIFGKIEMDVCSHSNGYHREFLKENPLSINIKNTLNKLFQTYFHKNGLSNILWINEY
ncbi:MAG: hypothetical protein K2X69_11575 [Silvanigrellaceae bacterium]|nr:hypothetical protein [Silvanigrellaceae bacterium]